MSFYFLYLHGFNGSPDGKGASELKFWIQKKYPGVYVEAPQWGHNPLEAIEMVSGLLDNAHYAKKIIFGNSMGGVMAHMLKQTRNDIDEVILLNPALAFKKIMHNFPREHVSNIDDSDIIITEDMIHTIDKLIPSKAINQKDYLLLLQEDDAVCNYKDTIDMLPEATIDVQIGQGHHYDDITKSFIAIEHFFNHKALLN
jgi:predicted esterase YcpF (UPF0227 family)